MTGVQQPSDKIQKHDDEALSSREAASDWLALIGSRHGDDVDVNEVK